MGPCELIFLPQCDHRSARRLHRQARTVPFPSRGRTSVDLAQCAGTWYEIASYPNRSHPFTGDYWIIELGGEYEYAVVSNPDRSYPWVLSRTPVMDDARYVRIIARLQERSFDTSRPVRTVQSGP